MKRLIGYIIAALVGATTLTGCGVSVPSDMVRIHMGDGMFENKKPKGCVPPGTKDNSITNDEYPLYPVNEREWDATGQEDSDSGRFKSVTQDNVEMYIPLTIRFTLITPKSDDDEEACDTLIEFHMNFGRRYGVEFEDDGSYNDEWITLLRKLVKDPSETALDRIVQDYNWRKVWNDPDTKAEIEERLLDPSEGIQVYIDRTAKGTYFEGFAVTMGSAEPVNEELQIAVANEQSLVAQAESERAQARAEIAKAKARTALAKAEAAERRAEVSGYGGYDNYLRALCIEAGCNPYADYVFAGTPPAPAQ